MEEASKTLWRKNGTKTAGWGDDVVEVNGSRIRGKGEVALGDGLTKRIAPCAHEYKVGLGSRETLCMGGATTERRARISI